MSKDETITLKEYLEKSMVDMKETINKIHFNLKENTDISNKSLEQTKYTNGKVIGLQEAIIDIKNILKNQQTDISELQKWRWITAGSIAIISSVGGLLVNLYVKDIASVKAKEEVSQINVTNIAETVVTKLEAKYNLKVK